MRTGVIFVVVLIVGSGVVFATADWGERAPPDSEGPSPESLADSTEGGETETHNGSRASSLSGNQTVSTLTQETTTAGTRLYIVTAESPASIDRDELAAYGTVGTQYEAQIELTTDAGKIGTVRNLSWVESVQPAETASFERIRVTASRHPSQSVQQLHQQGVTGEGVEVAVLDAGFDTTVPALAGAEVKRFRVGGETRHGTAVAEGVHRVAPDASLHLVTIGTNVDFKRAVDYLIAEDVDVIVFSGGFPFIDDDGDSDLSRKVEEAKQNGVVFVNSAGNLGRAHLEGGIQPNQGGFHDFGNDVNVACVPNCEVTYRGPIDVMLRYDDTGQPSEYNIYLIDQGGTQASILATGEIQTDEEEVRRIRGSVDSYTALGLAVRLESGVADDKLEIRLTAPSAIQHARPESSLTVPADSPAVIAVGAYDTTTGTLADFSSQGPNDIGSRSLDLIGPSGYSTTTYASFTGTSAAAPNVAGVAALLLEADSTLSVTEVESVLITSSDDRGATGVDPRTGGGAINATAAVESVAPQQDPVFFEVESLSKTASQGSTVTIQYQVQNPTGSATSALVELTSVPEDATVESVSGDVAQDLLNSTPPGVITTETLPGEAGSVQITLAVNATAEPGLRNVSTEATIQSGSQVFTNSRTTQYEVIEQNELVARFGGGDGVIGNIDVLRVVNAANSGTEIGGAPVSNFDVLRVVNRANQR